MSSTRVRLILCSAAAAAIPAILPQSSFAGFRIERIASGLNQPTYVTQAPGDPAKFIYYTERTKDAIGGFGAINDMGRVWKYDMETRTKSLVLDLSAVFPTRTVTNDTGLQSIAFHPNFNNVGSAGFGKMYVSYSERGSVAANNVEEFDIGPGGTATFNHRVLRYTNGSQNNHTVNWIGFDPNAAGADRNHLYISTGDGAFGLNYNNGTFTNGRPSQNPLSVRGKMLRVDITAGADAYPTNADRNYGIPASNPIPVFNAANPGSPINGLGEVWLTGLRNVSRASFDRANSDLYMGDVGEVAVEEVSFLKAGTNTGATPPVDYGWPQLEGTANSNISGAPHTTTNPFTGATSLFPIQQFAHVPGGNAVIGGYVHRGPIAELAVKYFYANFVPAGRLWMLDFDRDTNPGSFNGNNGTLVDLSQRFNSRVYDPNDPSYFSSTLITDLAGIDHIVSFGEDNAGNFYIVDFGNRSGTQSSFDGQYPAAGLGEIFRVVVGTINGTWNTDAGGSWYTSTNWTTGGVPGMVGDQAHFGPLITAPRTITLDGAHAVSTLTFNSVNTYVISGPGSLTLQGLSPAIVNVGAGTHIISAPVVLSGDLQVTTSTASGGLFITSGIPDGGDNTVTKLGPGFVQFASLRAGSLNATGGTTRISFKAGTPNTLGALVKNLSIGSSGGDGKLDLTNNSMIVDYTGPVGTLVDDTRANLLTGRLFSTAADATRVLGYGDNALLGFSSFAGTSVDGSSLLIKYTYAGDTDLDGDVDVGDLGTLATAWQTSALWTGGDFDYNGSVDVNDLGMLATNWQAGVGSPLGPESLSSALAALGLPNVAVPEPSVLPVLLLAPILAARKRTGATRVSEL
jgi:glucose/arabinose dehydrogenase